MWQTQLSGSDIYLSLINVFVDCTVTARPNTVGIISLTVLFWQPLKRLFSEFMEERKKSGISTKV